MVPRAVGSNPITHPRITMEHKTLIDLSIKYGLGSEELSKLVDVLYQSGIKNPDLPEFKKAAGFICEKKLLEMPADDLIEELKRNNLA